MQNVVKLRKSDYADDLLTFDEVSKKYGYKYGFIYKWCVLQKEIPCYDKGGYRAVSESDLIDFRNKRVKRWRA